MQYRELGRSGLSVSILSLGSGGPKKLGQADGMNQIDQTNLVRRALISASTLSTHPPATATLK